MEVDAMRSFAVAVALLAFLSGCVTSYYAQYQKQHPEWIPAFPDTHANLEQTVASIYAPSVTGNRLTVRSLEILRTDTDPWQEIAFSELRSGAFTSSDSQGYVVVADFVCQGRVELQSYRGEKIAYYLLPDNRLQGYDHYQFIEACTVYNDFRPATGDVVPLERSTLAWMEGRYPKSVFHVTEVFRKGLAYAKVGRVDDAKRMLALGLQGFDVWSKERPEFETPGIRIQLADERTARATRDQLVMAIERAERE
jgi:hypothetical protein